MSKPLGVYIHIPYCLKKCNYCDFCSYPEHGSADEYVSSLISHIKSQKRLSVDTVYIGGGTPTCLPSGDLLKILDALYDTFDVCSDAEITTECNPATADRAYFAALHDGGVNRVSIGMQSASDTELKALGRIHGFCDTQRAVSDAHDGGIDNINLDLMYGIPEQTLSSFSSSLTAALSLGVEHISAYALKIEEGTPFFRMQDRLRLPSEDEVCDMLDLCCRYLSSEGFERYEISNFARPGHACRHNLKYWHAEPYLAFGVSASGYYDSLRYTFTRSIPDYIRFCRGQCSADDVLDEKQFISHTESEREYIMLALRLCEGIDDEAFSRRFGYPFTEKYEEKLALPIRYGLMQKSGGRLYLTPAGLLVSNTIISELIY